MTVNRSGHRGGVEVFEINDGDGIARRLVDTSGDREVDRRDARACIQDQRVGSAAAVDRRFRAVVDDGVIAGSAADDVGAAAAVNDVVAGAAGDHVRSGGPRDGRP